MMRFILLLALALAGANLSTMASANQPSTMQNHFGDALKVKAFGSDPPTMEAYLDVSNPGDADCTIQMVSYQETPDGPVWLSPPAEMVLRSGAKYGYKTLPASMLPSGVNISCTKDVQAVIDIYDGFHIEQGILMPGIVGWNR